MPRTQKAEFVRDYAGDIPDHVRVVEVGLDEESGVATVQVQCDVHGELEMEQAAFAQSPNRCPGCSEDETGYAGHRLRQLLESGEEGDDAWLGLMEVEVEGIRSMLLGSTTQSLSGRYGPYLRKVLFKSRMKEIDALVLENQVLSKFSEDRDLGIFLAGMRYGKRWSGDTQCFEVSAAAAIRSFLKKSVDAIRKSRPDYWLAYRLLENPHFVKRDVARHKDLRNRAIPVVCVETGEQFESIAAARRATGAPNIGPLLRGEGGVTSGGYRWVSVADYQAGKIPELPKRDGEKPVICLDTGDRYPSVAAAQKATGATGIRGVAAGKRHTSGGLRWAYVADFEAGTVPEVPRKSREKAVRCLDTGQVYSSATAAAADTGVSLTAISLACTGRRKTAGKRRWEYLKRD